MNEPRSTVDLVVEQRQAATGPVYNITKNSGDTLQRWIEDMAQYVKRRVVLLWALPSCDASASFTRPAAASPSVRQSLVAALHRSACCRRCVERGCSDIDMLSVSVLIAAWTRSTSCPSAARASLGPARRSTCALHCGCCRPCPFRHFPTCRVGRRSRRCSRRSD